MLEHVAGSHLHSNSYISYSALATSFSVNDLYYCELILHSVEIVIALSFYSTSYTVIQALGPGLTGQTYFQLESLGYELVSRTFALNCGKLLPLRSDSSPRQLTTDTKLESEAHT